MQANNYFIFFLLYLVLFLIAIAAHELGHILYIKFILKKKIMSGWHKGHYFISFPGFREIAPKHKIGVSMAGILAGLLPLMIATSGLIGVVVVCLYLVGASHDIIKAAKNLGLLLGFKWDD